ncbi:MAG: hypothetical protein AB7O96_06565 [Pseudobdellovibrionaceae bacterium]
MKFCFVFFLFFFAFSAHSQYPQVPQGEIRAHVEEIKSSDSMIAKMNGSFGWKIGDRAYIVSQDDNKLILAVVEFQGFEESKDKDLRLIFTRRTSLGAGFIRPGDLVTVFDLSTSHSVFKGRNELLVRDRGDVSSRYKPIITQGLTIGETAQTLSQGDIMIDYTSYTYYGLTNNLTISSWGLGNLFGYPNLALKTRVWNSQFSVLGLGTSMVYDDRSDSGDVAIKLFLDSFDTRNQISHTSLTFSLVRWELKNKDSAIKVGGSRSIQTGYEFILENWDRILIGPSYDFDLKTVGGYISWLQIWDIYHLQIGLTSTNLASFKLDAKNGYFPAIQMYWRF